MNATCHPDKPNKAHGLCMNCYAKSRSESRKAWAEKNRDKVAAARERHAEKVGADEARRYHREYMRRWRAENLERARESRRLSYHRAKEQDPAAFREVRKAAYDRHIARPENLEKHRERGRERYRRKRADLTFKRRGVTMAEFIAYWEHRERLCDLCRKPLAMPGDRSVAVDHDKDHCGTSIGCRECVRGLLHRDCNLLEGAVRKARLDGLIDSMTGRLADYLADPPFKRWEPPNT